MPPVEQAVDFLREELKFPNLKASLSFQRTPIFLGHGTEDEKVPLGLGREAASCLRSLSGIVYFIEYEGLGHWYSGDMLRDLARFITKGR